MSLCGSVEITVTIVRIVVESRFWSRAPVSTQEEIALQEASQAAFSFAPHQPKFLLLEPIPVVWREPPWIPHPQFIAKVSNTQLPLYS